MLDPTVTSGRSLHFHVSQEPNCIFQNIVESNAFPILMFSHIPSLFCVSAPAAEQGHRALLLPLHAHYHAAAQRLLAPHHRLAEHRRILQLCWWVSPETIRAAALCFSLPLLPPGLQSPDLHSSKHLPHLLELAYCSIGPVHSLLFPASILYLTGSTCDECRESSA